MRPSTVVFVSAAPRTDPVAAAAAVAVAAGRQAGRAPALLDLCGRRGWRPGVLAEEAARARAATIGEEERRGGHGGESQRAPLLPLTRGRLVVIAPDADPDPDSGWTGSLIERLQAGGPLVVHTAPGSLHRLLDDRPPGSSCVLVTARRGDDRALCGLLAIELRRRSVPLKVWTGRIGPIQARRALAGLDPGGATAERAERTARALFGTERGQAIVALLGLIVCALLFALALVALGGAVGAKGRGQRAVDLAALSAARSMRDDFTRLMTPAIGADGRPDPRHLSRADYLDRAEVAAREAAGQNGLPAATVHIEFPDQGSFAPLRVAVSARPRIELDRGRADSGARGDAGARVAIEATAAAVPAGTAGTAPPTLAAGGGYGGPLIHRQGKPMRPDVAVAFDRLAAAAARAGHGLVVNSAFRSDAEQAALFAANPDPRWVARPGTSLHRCGTELDLGPPGAHAWLLSNSGRFGFVRRYAWEPWH